MICTGISVSIVSHFFFRCVKRLNVNQIKRMKCIILWMWLWILMVEIECLICDIIPKKYTKMGNIFLAQHQATSIRRRIFSTLSLSLIMTCEIMLLLFYYQVSVSLRLTLHAGFNAVARKSSIWICLTCAFDTRIMKICVKFSCSLSFSVSHVRSLSIFSNELRRDSLSWYVCGVCMPLRCHQDIWSHMSTHTSTITKWWSQLTLKAPNKRVKRKKWMDSLNVHA